MLNLLVGTTSIREHQFGKASLIMGALRVGAIGVGERSEIHLSTILRLKGRYQLVSVCDVDEARAGIVAERTGTRPFNNVEEMLRKEKLDVCLICVQAEGHHVIAKILAEKGIHMLTETPVAITVACANQMVDTAKDNGVILEVSENVPRWLRERIKQKIVAAGMIGSVKSFYLSYTSGSYHGMAAIRGMLRDEASTVSGKFPSEDQVLERAEIIFKSGITGTYEFNRNKGNYWEILGTEGAIKGSKICFYEDKSVLDIQTLESQTEDGQRILGAAIATRPEIAVENPFEEYHLSSQDEVAITDSWISLYNAVTEGKPLTYGPRNAKRDLELLTAVRESETLGGATVCLPIEGMTAYEGLIHEEFARIYGVDPLDTSLRHLKKRYVLPSRLHDLMYFGRTLEAKGKPF